MTPEPHKDQHGGPLGFQESLLRKGGWISGREARKGLDLLGCPVSPEGLMPYPGGLLILSSDRVPVLSVPVGQQPPVQVLSCFPPQDWPFDDGAPPPGKVVEDWLSLLKAKFCDDPGSCVAVHCVAGLGR